MFRFYPPFLIALIALGTPSLASAQDRQEWHDQLIQRVARNSWDGADAAYVGLLETAGTATPDEHLLGAKASLALGNINDAAARLEGADDTDAEVIKELTRLRERYAAAKLKASGGRNAASLVARDNPIDSAERRTVELAGKALQSEGKYRGLLPIGRYRLGETEFEVVAGQTAKAKP